MILRRVIAHFRKQEWTAIALDFLIVVCGILIAFQITAWNEARRERALERNYLERIATELGQSIVAMEDSIVTAQEREDLGRFLMKSVQEPTLFALNPAVLSSPFSPAATLMRRKFAPTHSKK